jgi:hypothetical protein
VAKKDSTVRRYSAACPTTPGGEEHVDGAQKRVPVSLGQVGELLEAAEEAAALSGGGDLRSRPLERRYARPARGGDP